MKSARKTFPFSIQKAHQTQLRLSKRIVLEDRLPKKIRLIAGVDVAYAGDESVGAVTVLDYQSLKVVESQIATCKTRFSYIPTLLSFREVAPTILCIRKLQTQPDIFLVDGQGYAHPYRCGFASHLGLVLKKPTVGVAKSRLVGEVEDMKEKGPTSLLRHNGEIIGAQVTTKLGSKPIYVSVGHMVTLETAVKIVNHCIREHNAPEPILAAHRLASSEKRKINIA